MNLTKQLKDLEAQHIEIVCIIFIILNYHFCFFLLDSRIE